MWLASSVCQAATPAMLLLSLHQSGFFQLQDSSPSGQAAGVTQLSQATTCSPPLSRAQIYRPSCSSRWQHGQEKAHHYSSQEERNLSAKVLPSDKIISFLSRECQRGNSAAPYTAHQIAWRAVGLTDTRILRKGMPLLKSGPTDGAIKNTLA